jgi:hypothetical protein
MIDPELKKELDDIDQHLLQLAKASKPKGAFFRGVLAGIGSILGVAIAIAVLGWFLNVIGVIPGFREQANEWKRTLDRIDRLR